VPLETVHLKRRFEFGYKFATKLRVNNTFSSVLKYSSTQYIAMWNKFMPIATISFFCSFGKSLSIPELILTKLIINWAVGQSSAANSSSCSTGWEQYKDEHCYQIIHQLTHFDVAEKLCQEKGATFVRIHFKEEQDFLVDYIKRSGIADAVGGCECELRKGILSDRGRRCCPVWTDAAGEMHPSNQSGVKWF